MLAQTIKDIREGRLTNLGDIVALLEAEDSGIRTSLDLAYQNGRVDALHGDYKRSYSDWKYPAPAPTFKIYKN